MSRETAVLAALALAGCATTSVEHAASPAHAAHAAAEETQPGTTNETGPLQSAAPDTMRWLYGSGEAAAASIQAWRMLADYVAAKSATRPPESIPMGIDGAVGPTNCRHADGSAKPLAAVFDVDETVLLNLGYEQWQAAHGDAYDAQAWSAWEKSAGVATAPVPGAVTGLRRIREAGVAVVFNTNRLSENAQSTAAALKANGLGDAVHGETLFLKGDDAAGSAKDGRRAMIAEKYCVLAMAGDNLGDFADLLNDPGNGVLERRDLAGRGALAPLWGNGWFVIPNPVYGAAIRGSLADVFPTEARWSPGDGAANGGK